MPLSYVQYAGDGVTRTFSVPFPYISRAHVMLRVDGVVVDFNWLSSTSVQALVAPAEGTVVEVRRSTPRDELLVDFVDGSVLVETDLDLSALQVFYLTQEAFDTGDASLSVTPDGSYSAGFRRISQVADPVSPQDVVTYAWIVSTTNPIVVSAQAARDAAQSYRDQAQGYANDAAASAALAATFDPANYWTAVQADARFAPISHSHPIVQVTGLQTALDGKAASSHSHAIGDLPVATQVEAETGTDTTKVMNPLRTAQAIAARAGDKGVLHVRDEKPQGTVSGNTLATTWQTRDLTTTVLNTITGASLNTSTGVVTLPAGTYDIEFKVPFYSMRWAKARLLNTVTSTELFRSHASSWGTSTANGNDVIGRCRLVFASETSFRIEQFSYSAVTGGFGWAFNSGGVEIYTELFIRKVS